MEKKALGFLFFTTAKEKGDCLFGLTFSLVEKKESEKEREGHSRFPARKVGFFSRSQF
jgi:hypothetical protein